MRDREPMVLVEAQMNSNLPIEEILVQAALRKNRIVLVVESVIEIEARAVPLQEGAHVIEWWAHRQFFGYKGENVSACVSVVHRQGLARTHEGYKNHDGPKQHSLDQFHDRVPRGGNRNSAFNSSWRRAG